MRKLTMDARADRRLSNGMLWLIGAAVLSVLIVSAGLMIDRQTALTERGRIEHGILDRLLRVQSDIETHLDQDINIALSLADDIADDGLLSPLEFNRTVNRLITDNPQLDSIRLAPLDDPARMAFTPKVTRDSRTISVDIPVPPVSWQSSTAWISLVVDIDAGRFFDHHGLLTEVDVPDHEGHDHTKVAIVMPSADGTDEVFGDETIFDDNPISTASVGGRLGYNLYGVPADGWDAAMNRLLPSRLLVLAGVIAMTSSVLLALFLLRERNLNIKRLRAREQRLVELSQRFQLALETSNIGIWEIDASTHALIWDSRSAGLHGLPNSLTDEEDRLADWFACLHADDIGRAEQFYFDSVVAATADQWDISYRVPLSDDSFRYLRSVGARTSDGSITGIVCDVTTDTLVTQSLSRAKENSDIKNAELELALEELSSREHQLAEASQRLDLALGSYNCGTWEGDPVTKSAIWDERMHQLYGIPFSDKPVAEHVWLSRLHPDDRGEIQLATKRAVTLDQIINTTQRVVLQNGEIRYIRSVGQPHIGRDGKKKLIGIAFDVTADALLAEQLRNAKAEADMRNIELELAKNRIEFNALHDPLTSLANRRKLDLELDTLARNGNRQSSKFAILHLDLDRFKEINDTLGHAAGDAMLVHASRILMKHVPRGDLVARIGGDEFVVLARRQTSVDELATLANKIIDEMRQPLDFEGFDCRCGVSIGVAQSQGAAPDPRKVLINADIALYQAKEKGRNCYEFFTPDLQANIVAKKRMADDMLAGLDRDEFIVWYQPQFEASSMQLCGAEALIRWRHPDRGILASGNFLKVAEDLNVMARIDELVLQTALKDQMRWTALGMQVPRISVNVSSKRLHDDNLIDQLKGLSITPGSICFELVESIFLDDSDTFASENIERIKALGIDIEIDDFGTGHTSIVSLLKLKPKRLKIDRQLVMPVTVQPQERSLVRNIVEIARSLGIETVAEGVETHEHAGILRQLGCDYLQGYAFAKPLSFEDFTRFVDRLPQRKAS
ncbi:MULTISPECIES: GGDEF domain-containing phosphodiesterase [Rhizobium/Agrobacterium group]|uniref:bifunctional diguanylate cyclase/phosphodiesterase n=1 Tax=Rhizobium/Agrobacterium group TaxID=227290 RepID=UPI0006B9DDE2|nr:MULTISPECIES: GGDEF domain-containing phosphodiesterase [Rhizobium/Agrobacterium group]QGG89628.1 EAL domain-containing protein [Agrobacterium sp. MA01]